MRSSIFINKFSKGTQQSPSLGTGAIVGFDAYSKPGTVILGKKISSTYALPNTSEFVTYMDVSNSSNATPSIAVSARLWAQSNLGIVYYSDNYGATFSLPTYTGTPPSGAAANGNGLIVYENYIFVFFNSEIWYAIANAAAPNFVQWKTGIDSGTVSSGTTPIFENHFPYLFPNNRGVYFANNNAIGTFGQVFVPGSASPTAFNPAGVLNTDYIYLPIKLNIPQNYSNNVLESIAPGNLAIGSSNLYSGQEGDIFTWDTKTNNGFTFPIRFFSGLNINGAQGIKQIANRLNVIYTALGGNHAIYATNGGTANIVADLSLYSNIRNYNVNANGKEYPLPLYFNSYPSAISAMGNKILTGVATSKNNSYYVSGAGVFPTGVWSIYFNNDGSTLQQMEYSLTFGGGVIGSTSPYSQPTDFGAITAIKPLSNGQIAIASAYQLGGTITIGNVTIFDNINYIQDKTLTSLESEMFEIGTFMNPATPNNIEINLIKNLLSDQQIEISYRKSNDADWSIIETFTGDGTRNYYAIQQHGIGPTQYLQLRYRANTGVTNPNDTPELRTIIVS